MSLEAPSEGEEGQLCGEPQMKRLIFNDFLLSVVKKKKNLI